MVPRRALGVARRRSTPRSPAYLGALARWTRASSSTRRGPVPLAASRQMRRTTRPPSSASWSSATRSTDCISTTCATRTPTSTTAQRRSPRSARACRRDGPGRRTAAARPRRHRRSGSVAEALAAEWAAFRRDRLTSLVRPDCTASCAAARPAAIVSAAVFPSAAAARDGSSRTGSAGRAPAMLDVACPMIYTTDAAEFATLAAEIDAALGAVPFWAGIGAYKLRVSRRRSSTSGSRVARRRPACCSFPPTVRRPRRLGQQISRRCARSLLETVPGSGPTR